MKKHTDLTTEERDYLEIKIDNAFTKTIISPRKNKVVEFLKNILNQKKEFQLIENTEKLEVIELFYYGNCPLGFLFVEPSSSFYDYSLIKNRPELKMEDYNYFHIEAIIRKTLDENNIDYSKLIVDDFLEYEFFWENRQDLEKNFLLNCWKQAKEETNSKIYGILYASDMSGCGTDLDTGMDLWNENGGIEVVEYFNGIGIYPSKKLLTK